MLPELAGGSLWWHASGIVQLQVFYIYIILLWCFFCTFKPVALIFFAFFVWGVTTVILLKHAALQWPEMLWVSRFIVSWFERAPVRWHVNTLRRRLLCWCSSEALASHNFWRHLPKQQEIHSFTFQCWSWNVLKVRGLDEKAQQEAMNRSKPRLLLGVFFDKALQRVLAYHIDLYIYIYLYIGLNMFEQAANRFMLFVAPSTMVILSVAFLYSSDAYQARWFHNVLSHATCTGERACVTAVT